jgi:hypothetical protein
LDKDEIKTLYWDKHHSITEISKILGVGRNRIWRFMKREDISRKKPSYCARVDRRINISPSPDLAYIIGVLDGDGFAGGSEHKIKLEVTSEAFRDSFFESMGRVGLKSFKNERKQRMSYLYGAFSSSRKFVKFYKGLGEEGRRNILRTDDYIREYLRGTYESEGSSEYVNEGNSTHVRACFSTVRKRMEFLQELLKKLGFVSDIHGPRTTSYGSVTYELALRGGWRENNRFFDEIAPIIKVKKINRSSIENSLWTEKEVKYLREHYRERPPREIAKILKRSLSSVSTKRWKLGLKGAF